MPSPQSQHYFVCTLAHIANIYYTIPYKTYTMRCMHNLIPTARRDDNDDARQTTARASSSKFSRLYAKTQGARTRAHVSTLDDGGGDVRRRGKLHTQTRTRVRTRARQRNDEFQIDLNQKPPSSPSSSWSSSGAGENVTYTYTCATQEALYLLYARIIM